MKVRQLSITLALGLTLALALAWALLSGHTSSVQAAPTDGVIYVDRDANGANNGTSWSEAYTDLGDALKDADPGNEIWVAEGIYTPTYRTVAGDPRSATFSLTQGVAVYGGFAATETLRSQRDWTAHITVLSGDIDGNDTVDDNGIVTDTANITGTNAYHVVFGIGVTETAVLDGFTITAGKGGTTYPDQSGGGMYNVGSPTLTNVVFAGNRSRYGGGICNFGDPMLTNVAFVGNYAEDDGGGMWNYNNSSATLTNVIFSGNYAHDDGGGMRNGSSSASALINVTFSGNSASTGIGGGISTYGYTELTNCILWSNSAGTLGDQIYAGGGSTITITFSLIQGAGGSGVGNIDSNPLFADADGPDDVYGTLDDDLRLSPVSPAVDAGDNTAISTTVDLGGEPRFIDVVGKTDTGNGTPPIVDMGAYEASGVVYNVYLPLALRQ